jgi:hypothetical protein
MPEMDDFDGMGVAGHWRRMVVIPSVRCRCRGRSHQSGALDRGICAHVFPPESARLSILFNTVAPLPIPKVGRAEDKCPDVDTTPQPLRLHRTSGQSGPSNE